MASNSNLSGMLSQLDKLSEENFHSWKSGMMMFLTAARASWILEEKDSVVPSHLKEKDQHLLFYIWANIEPDLWYIIDRVDSGKTAWVTALEHFQKLTMGRQVKACKDLYHIKQDPDKPIDSYIHTIDTACKNL